MIRHPGLQRLSRFADAAPGDPAHAAVARHLEGCARCREEVARLRAFARAAEGAVVPPPAGDALARILERRARGDRVLLPAAEPVPAAHPLPVPTDRPIRRPRLRFAAVLTAAAASVALLVVAGTVHQGADGGVTVSRPAAHAARPGGELRVTPAAPLAGQAVAVEYRAPDGAGDAPSLRLEARLWGAGDSARTVTVPLQRSGDGRYAGRIALPAGATYARLTVTDTAGLPVAPAPGGASDLLVHDADGRPLYAALRRQSAELAALDPEGARRASLRAAHLWPDSGAAPRPTLLAAAADDGATVRIDDDPRGPGQAFLRPSRRPRTAPGSVDDDRSVLFRALPPVRVEPAMPPAGFGPLSHPVPTQRAEVASATGVRRLPPVYVSESGLRVVRGIGEAGDAVTAIDGVPFQALTARMPTLDSLGSGPERTAGRRAVTPGDDTVYRVRARLAAGDTATAFRAMARALADPSSSRALLDSISGLAYASAPGGWVGRVEEARRTLRRELRAYECDLPVPEGRTRAAFRVRARLIDRSREGPTVVAVWRRIPRDAEAAVAELRAFEAQARGARIHLVLLAPRVVSDTLRGRIIGPGSPVELVEGTSSGLLHALSPRRMQGYVVLLDGRLRGETEEAADAIRLAAFVAAEASPRGM